MQRVLILCTGNSCRSQMAEALWEELSAGQWTAASAGSKPSGYVHSLAVLAMSECGLDISRHRSKSLKEFQNEAFDLVVTVCDNAKDACPVFAGANQTLHWPFDDPAQTTGSEKEKMACFGRVRDEIKNKIAEYINKDYART